LVAQLAVAELAALRTAAVREQRDEPRVRKVQAAPRCEVVVQAGIELADRAGEPRGPARLAEQEPQCMAWRLGPRVLHPQRRVAELLGDRLECGAEHIR